MGKTLQIPPPANWQDFEELCCDLWREIWQDPHTQLNGRAGQPQCGVDVFGRPGRSARWAGVQCKLTTDLVGSRLTVGELKAEVEKARSFNPRLAELIVATTGPRDEAVQRAAREITEAHAAAEAFSVTVYSWQDICRCLADHEEVLEKYYPGLAGSSGGTGALRDQYLGALWERLYPLPLLGVGREGSRREDVPLAAVYTALDVAAEIHVELEGSKESQPLASFAAAGLKGNPDYLKQLQQRVRQEAAETKKEQLATTSYTRRWSALEAAAAARRLVLVGPAGSGKSTFARYLALCLAGEGLGRGAANLARLEGLPAGQTHDLEQAAWPHGPLLPVFVELRKLVRSAAFPAPGETGRAGHLLAYLEAQGPEQLAVGPLLRAALERRDGALVILDGLDETPAAEASRRPLRQIIVALIRRFPQCRVLVTCRPYAYESTSPWRLDDEEFVDTRLAPFDETKIRAFITAWYQHLAGRQQVDVEQVAPRSAALWREINGSSYLEPLAERPLMLTMMADLHASAGGRLPGGRAGLYERSVDLLLDRWNEMRKVLGGETLAEHLGLRLNDVRQALQGLAYDVHRERGQVSGDKSAEIPATELWTALDARRQPPHTSRVDERQVMDYLHQRSGILVGESPTLYRFPHRSYQEYLAACHLVHKEFPHLLLSEVERDPALWREVLLLAAGKVADPPFMAWALLAGLVPAAPEEGVAADDPRFIRALYAGLAVQENELWRDVQAQDAGKLERIRQWLERSLVLGALAPVDRAAAGRVLATLGDQRPGVSLRGDGIPDVVWVEIPAGPFLMGSSDDDRLSVKKERPQHQVIFKTAYRISRYPVTNAQYRAFVDDGGYGEREHWSDAGWQWKGERQGPSDDLPPAYLLGNHPRVNVSWYEATAFCRWLSNKLGCTVRLPSEAEWEKAARGDDGRIYPWGNNYDPSRGNLSETGLRQNCSVGLFPSGVSPYDVLDLCGNVWEWTLDERTKDYSGREGGFEIDASAVVTADLVGGASAGGTPASGVARVIRGGSYWYEALYARSAYRFWSGPLSAYGVLGFRVVLPVDPSDPRP